MTVRLYNERPIELNTDKIQLSSLDTAQKDNPQQNQNTSLFSASNVGLSGFSNSSANSSSSSSGGFSCIA